MSIICSKFSYSGCGYEFNLDTNLACFNLDQLLQKRLIDISPPSLQYDLINLTGLSTRILEELLILEHRDDNDYGITQAAPEKSNPNHILLSISRVLNSESLFLPLNNAKFVVKTKSLNIQTIFYGGLNEFFNFIKIEKGGKIFVGYGNLRSNEVRRLIQMEMSSIELEGIIIRPDTEDKRRGFRKCLDLDVFLKTNDSIFLKISEKTRGLFKILDFFQFRNLKAVELKMSTLNIMKLLSNPKALKEYLSRQIEGFTLTVSKCYVSHKIKEDDIQFSKEFWDYFKVINSTDQSKRILIYGAYDVTDTFQKRFHFTLKSA